MCKKVKYLYLFIDKKCSIRIQLLQRKVAIFVFIEIGVFRDSCGGDTEFRPTL